MPNAEDILKADYIDAVTLAERKAIALTQDSENLGVFSVPNGEGFYGHYKIFETFVENLSILE